LFCLQVIKERADKELGSIVKRTARDFLESSSKPSSVMTTKNDKDMIQGDMKSIPEHLLQEFIDALLSQLRCVADIHETVVIVHLKRVSQEDIDIYSMKDMWNKIQSVVEVVADYYSNLNESKGSEAGEADLSSFFVKKKPEVNHLNLSEKERIFRFHLSSPAMIFNAYLEEQQS
jgi:hypothetical protein